MLGAVDVVAAFNDAINARDLDALTQLMADDHRFVDAAGATVDGKATCTDAWHGFFTAYPDYRNIFERTREVATGVVEVVGHSECSEPLLAGPACWRAVVRDGKVALWQVSDA